MKILVCGGRNYTNYSIVKNVLLKLKEKYGTFTVIEGGQRGADILAKQVAEELGLPIIQKDAEWTKYGKAAGPIRNRLMLKEDPDLVLAFHEDIRSSKGTMNMVVQARAAGKPVEIYT